MRKWINIGLVAAVTAVITVAACRKPGEEPDNNNNAYDRGAMLTNLADGYIVPAYSQMSATLAALKGKAEAFTAAPDELKLSDLQAAWKDAYLLWQKVEMLEFGPEQTTALRMYMSIYPVSVSKINSNIASGSYNLEEFGNTDAQGFPALDYLLNGLDNSNSAILNYYTAHSEAANRRQYLLNVITKMQQKITAVRDAWTGGYRNTFVSATGTDVSSSLSLMVNAFVLHYERYVRSGKVGLPVGAMTGVAAPQLTEAYYSPSMAKELAISAINAVNSLYEGINFEGTVNGNGFKDYLAAIGTKDMGDKLMADIITDELGEARTAFMALGTPLKDAVVNDRPTVLNIYTEMQQVVPLLKVDMVSAFGISITYVDNDGD
ncbi:MAG: imelysin family protein [Flavipsychrobacter sp.]|nr:imelysin family protein [Flavipsychrobacter sp.]